MARKKRSRTTCCRTPSKIHSLSSTKNLDGSDYDPTSNSHLQISGYKLKNVKKSKANQCSNSSGKKFKSSSKAMPTNVDDSSSVSVSNSRSEMVPETNSEAKVNDLSPSELIIKHITSDDSAKLSSTSGKCSSSKSDSRSIPSTGCSDFDSTLKKSRSKGTTDSKSTNLLPKIKRNRLSNSKSKFDFESKSICYTVDADIGSVSEDSKVESMKNSKNSGIHSQNSSKIMSSVSSSNSKIAHQTASWDHGITISGVEDDRTKSTGSSKKNLRNKENKRRRKKNKSENSYSTPASDQQYTTAAKYDEESLTETMVKGHPQKKKKDKLIESCISDRDNESAEYKIENCDQDLNSHNSKPSYTENSNTSDKSIICDLPSSKNVEKGRKKKQVMSNHQDNDRKGEKDEKQKKSRREVERYQPPRHRDSNVANQKFVHSSKPSCQNNKIHTKERDLDRRKFQKSTITSLSKNHQKDDGKSPPFENQKQNYPQVKPQAPRHMISNSDEVLKRSSYEKLTDSHRRINYKIECNVRNVESFSYICEVVRDLFSVDESYSLAHCVSKDLRMGRGVAVEFKNRFGRVDELMHQRKDVGSVAFLKEGRRFIYYIITKKFYYEKPTMKSIEEGIWSLRALSEEHHVEHLAMPLIGCGLDKLNWNRVRSVLGMVFKNSPTKILVCHFD